MALFQSNKSTQMHRLNGDGQNKSHIEPNRIFVLNKRVENSKHGEKMKGNNTNDSVKEYTYIRIRRKNKREKGPHTLQVLLISRHYLSVSLCLSIFFKLKRKERDTMQQPRICGAIL
jgi:hypothetical protein